MTAKETEEYYKHTKKLIQNYLLKESQLNQIIKELKKNNISVLTKINETEFIQQMFYIKTENLFPMETMNLMEETAKLLSDDIEDTNKSIIFKKFFIPTKEETRIETTIIRKLSESY